MIRVIIKEKNTIKIIWMNMIIKRMMIKNVMVKLDVRTYTGIKELLIVWREVIEMIIGLIIKSM